MYALITVLLSVVLMVPVAVHAASQKLDSALFTPQTFAQGSDYLSRLIGTAFDELREKNIASRFDKSKLVVDVIDPYLLKSLIVSEHTDHTSLLKRDAEGTMETFLVRLAVEGEDAFTTRKSRKGAQGLLQFIKPTYTRIVRTHPEYQLINDFKAGMADHKNALKAAVALLDAELAASPKAIQERFRANPHEGGLFLAAAYNGGAGRVYRAFKNWKDTWKTRHKTGTGLKWETVIYLTKVEKAYAMFSAGMYATPLAPTGGIPDRQLAALIPSEPQAFLGPVCFADGKCVSLE